jgi:RimJ/RimL family protein N-acetyltransferase
MQKIPHDSVLATDRLVLKEPSPDLAATMFACLTPAITRHMNFYPPKTVGEQRRAILRLLKDNAKSDAWHAAVFAKGSGEFLGMCGVAEYFEDTATAEIWYWLTEKHQGNGYVTEAARALCRHLFDECELNRILIRVEAANAPSRAVAERLGAKLDGVLRSHVLRKGDLKDVAFYTLFSGELS